MPDRNVIIVAGGSGVRMQHATPKQFLEVAGKPVIVHSIEAFLKFDPSISVTIVLPKAHFGTWDILAKKYLPTHQMQCVEGGQTRFQSVRSGLSTVKAGLVAIHDSVRPLVTGEVIGSSFDAAESHGSGVAMVPLKDSIRRKEGAVTRAEDRTSYFLVQTPQTFRVDLIKTAFQQEEVVSFTDDASVYEAAGMQVWQVPGSYRNIKITTREDLLMVRALMNEGSIL